ncbi:filament-like plant protein 7 [Phragmites australis]|uniref:filament-like plant protein 7 n=1 Tax=Phragmites australis TaxID=29695 RepID=UPI002D79D2D6|nr:filament-like plant protein 7 [Phragmites australis]
MPEPPGFRLPWLLRFPPRESATRAAPLDAFLPPQRANGSTPTPTPPRRRPYCTATCPHFLLRLHCREEQCIPAVPEEPTVWPVQAGWMFCFQLDTLSVEIYVNVIQWYCKSYGSHNSLAKKKGAITEMEEALKSCVEQLVIAREEREQIIVEAANEISSEKKKVRELQHKLEDANKNAAKLAAENSSLCKAVDDRDTMIREVRESEAAAGDKLADATARLESAQKQGVSLRYEVRMLQKELEVRGQEREYDLKSVDAAQRQQAEHLKRIAQLEAECQRLRAMVRKRLPGPAAIAKMRDEVEQQQPPPPGARPRRPRPATPSTPRSVTPFSPRTPRRSVSDAESYAFKLRAVEDENKALKQVLAKRESELQFVQMKYADEACKLTVVQRQLKDLTEENWQLSDANCQSESWASALISELEHFRSGNQGGASIMASSDMNLLDDFAEIEKMEMAPGDRKRNTPRASLEKADTRSVTPEKNDNGLVMNGSIPNGHPERVHDIWDLVMHKHDASGESVDTILEKIRHELDLDRSTIYAKREYSDVSYDRSEVEKMVRNLVEEVTPMIHKSAEDNVARSRLLLHYKPELCGRLENLVHVCHDLLHGSKANLGKFIDEVCLILKYIVSQYLSNQDPSDTVDSDIMNIDGVKSLGTINTEGQQDIQSAKPAAALDIQKDAQVGPIQSAECQIMASLQEKLDKELTRVILAQDDNILQGRKSTYCEIESPSAEASVEDWAAQEENQLPTNSEILAAAGKIAHCQETITILSKQLQALKIPTTSGPLDSPFCNPRPSSALSDYKPQSLGSILAEEFANAVGSRSPATPKEVQFKKKDDELYATPKRSTAQEQNGDPRKKKKRGPSLLGRIMFRKKVEGSS